MTNESLSVPGLTGVEVNLPVAGLGTRAYAFLIDWHIRVLLALAWLLIGMLVVRFGFGLPVTGKKVSTLMSLGVILPTAALYFLYHPVLEVLLQGRTPGKRMAGTRIVTLEGGTPGPAALLLRNLFRLIDSIPAFYVLGLGFCLFTERSVRIGDLAAGTLLVLDDAKAKSASLARVGAIVEQSALEPRAAALVQDVIDRWSELDELRRTQLACGLIEKLDPGIAADQVWRLSAAEQRARLQGLLDHV